MQRYSKGTLGGTDPRRLRVERVTVPCAACGKPKTIPATLYAKRTTGRVFCNTECRAAVGSRVKTGVTATCGTCGDAVYVMPCMTDKQRFCSRACANLAQQNRKTFTCEVCSGSFSVAASTAATNANRFCSRACMAVGNIKRPAGFVHNGKPAKLDQWGYVWVYQPDHPNAVRFGWIAQHRLVAAQMLGRTLTPEDEVHHINRDKADNRPENLSVLDGKTHALLSVGEKQSDKELLAAYIERYGHL